MGPIRCYHPESIPQSSSITGTLPSDSFVSDPEHSFVGVLPLCRIAVCVLQPQPTGQTWCKGKVNVKSLQYITIVSPYDRNYLFLDHEDLDKRVKKIFRHYLFGGQIILNCFQMDATHKYGNDLVLSQETQKQNACPGLGSIPDRVIPKTSKMVLDTSLLNTQWYKVHIKGKVEQSREGSSALPYTLVL